MSLSKPKPLQECRTVVDFAYRERYVYLTESDNFRIVFRENLSKFWTGNLTGFDVVAFDNWLGTPDGTACRDQVAVKFGTAGLEIIDKLLHINEG